MLGRTLTVTVVAVCAAAVCLPLWASTSLAPVEAAAAFTGIEADKWAAVDCPRSCVAVLQTSGVGCPTVRVYVDTRHRRVCAVYYVDRAWTGTCPATDEGRAGAERVAVEYALRLAPEFATSAAFDLAIPVPSADSCRAYVFTWREKRGDAYTGTTLTVSVTATEYEVRSGFIRLPPPGPLPEPRVPKAAACELAAGAARRLNISEAAIGEAELVLSHPCAPDEGPAWLVEVRSPDWHTPELVCIDAVTGAVLIPDLTER